MPPLPHQLPTPPLAPLPPLVVPPVVPPTEPDHKQRLYILVICVLLLIAAVIFAHVYNCSIYNANSAANPSVSGQSRNQNSSATLKPIASSTTQSNASSIPKKILVKPAVPVTPPPAPESVISAEAYLVGNVDTGQIYLSYNPQKILSIASISKLFVTLVVKANMDPQQIIQITQPILDVYPDAYGLTLGEQFTVSDLLNPLLLQSNNNVAEGFAMTYGYDAFIAKMNDLATSLGLLSTHFHDASGLSPGNVSSANDLFNLGRYLYTNDQDILALTTLPSVNIASTTDHNGHVFVNIEPFVGDPNFVGGKTGRTDEAGETMLSIFNYKTASSTYPIAIVVLHSDLGTRQIDSEALLIRAITLIQNQTGQSN